MASRYGRYDRGEDKQQEASINAETEKLEVEEDHVWRLVDVEERVVVDVCT